MGRLNGASKWVALAVSVAVVLGTFCFGYGLLSKAVDVNTVDVAKNTRGITAFHAEHAEGVKEMTALLHRIDKRQEGMDARQEGMELRLLRIEAKVDAN